MNKYKMISICSLTIACVLMLSILLPVKTIANDKESIELSMHYENAQVTANIVVNSDVYSGVVCKYLITDDVLTSDDILAQTRENGTTISLDKSEDDKYTAVIPSVDKRYVVIYVSIGNCSLCDYIDCKPGESSKEETSDEQTSSSDDGHNMSVVGEGENGQVVEATTDNKNEQPAEESKEESQPVNDENKEESEQPAEEENNTQEQVAEENKQEVTAQPVENKTEQEVQNNSQQPENSEKKEEKIVVDNTQQTQQSDFQAIEEATSTNKEDNKSQSNSNNNNAQTKTQTSSNKPATNSNSYDKDSIDVSNKNNNTKNTSSGNKNTVDTTDFEEIEKVISTSTANEDMPQTGEDDFAKILGIVVFSAISAVSFYKYKTTK